MATIEQMEKKRSRQIEEILAATNYLKVAFMEISTASGEALEANAQVFDELQVEMLKTEIYGVKQQVAELSGQIAELKIILTTPAPAMAVPVDKTRRTKK